MAWTLFFIDRSMGPLVFLLLSVVLFLVGGGVAQLLPSAITWAIATRLNKPLSWWKRTLSKTARERFGRWWPMLYSVGCALTLAGVGIWLIVLPPGRPGFDRVTPLHFMDWSFLGAGLLFLVATMVSGFCRDIERGER